jgi:hypothetical protein
VFTFGARVGLGIKDVHMLSPFCISIAPRYIFNKRDISFDLKVLGTKIYLVFMGGYLGGGSGPYIKAQCLRGGDIDLPIIKRVLA